MVFLFCLTAVGLAWGIWSREGRGRGKDRGWLVGG